MRATLRRSECGAGAAGWGYGRASGLRATMHCANPLRFLPGYRLWRERCRLQWGLTAARERCQLRRGVDCRMLFACRLQPTVCNRPGYRRLADRRLATDGQATGGWRLHAPRARGGQATGGWRTGDWNPAYCLRQRSRRIRPDSIGRIHSGPAVSARCPSTVCNRLSARGQATVCNRLGYRWPVGRINDRPVLDRRPGLPSPPDRNGRSASPRGSENAPVLPAGEDRRTEERIQGKQANPPGVAAQLTSP